MFLNKVLCKYKTHINRAFSSALFISGEKAKNMYAVLVPCLDFDEKFKNIDKLNTNVSRRNMDIDVFNLKKMWDAYKLIEEQKLIIESKRSKIAEKIKLLNKEKSTDSTQTEIKHLVDMGKLLRDDLKNIKEHLWKVEENVVLQALQLPNDLHQRTPFENDTILHISNNKPTSHSLFHIDVGKEKDLIDYQAPSMYFLKNEAAIYELDTMFKMSDYFSKFGFIEFSNYDFSRSVVVEGCGINYEDSTKIYTLEEPEKDEMNPCQRLHLVGGASLVSFMAFHTKNSIFPSLLPLKRFTVGRQYTPNKSDENLGLFDVTQTTAFQVFVACIDSQKEMETEFDSLLAKTIEFYRSLGHHFRVVYKTAKDLERWECLRADFEMYSPYLKSYTAVGHLSICDNYISKRLLFTYTENKERLYPKIISGTVLNFAKYLACVLEQSDKTNIKTFLDDSFC